MSVLVIYHREPDGWWAEAPEVPGWTAAAATLPDLQELAQEGVAFALDRDVVEISPELADDEGRLKRADLVFDFVLGTTVVPGDADAASRGPRQALHA